MNIKYISFCLFSCSVSLMACGTENVITKSSDTEDTKDSSMIVTALVTSADRSYELDEQNVTLKEGAANSATNRILLVPTTQYQTMDGFGAAVTGSTCYNLLRMSEENRTEFLKQTFSETEGYGFSYIRISIGCSDFSLSEYTCCDKEGIENFALTNEEKKYVIPILKEILAINPDVKIMAAPWTAPPWMKVTAVGGSTPYDSWTGGHVAEKYYQNYATYFVKWIQAFQENGINIYAVTPQNEPLNSGNSASTLMYWSEEQAFIRDALGPQFASAGITTRIYAYDHNYDYGSDEQSDYPIKIYNDEVAASFITGAAYHNYSGDKSELTDIHNKSNKGLLFTETSIGTWNDGRNLSSRLMDDMSEVALGTVNNWCTGVMVWNLMLNTDMGPNRDGGCQTCYGAVDISTSDYATITRNSHYFIIAHLSSVVKPGAVRIGTSNGTSLSGITSAAFQNEDSTYSVVLMDENSDVKVVTISDGSYYFNYPCPAKSAVSFRWNK